MKKTLLAIMLFGVLSMQSQIHFEKGYFILNNGTKTECLIKNNEWDNNPTKIYYKTNENSEAIKLDISEILEFSVFNSSKFGRFNVEIDDSSDNTNELGENKNPEYKKKSILLRYLVEGSANLYLYSVTNTIKYFYSTNNSTPIQLIYKKYFLQDQPDKIRVNSTYKQQLFNSINCNNIDFKQVDKIDYNQKSLENYFTNFNQCKGDKKIEIASTPTEKGTITSEKPLSELEKNSTQIEKPKSEIENPLTQNENPSIQKENSPIEKYKERKGKFQFGPTLGISQSSFSITNIDYKKQTLNFNSTTSVSFGAELEYIFGFYKNKWSIFLNPNYNKNSSKANYNFTTLSLDLNEDLNSEIKTFELPFGIRHYMFLNDKSKLFIDFGVLFSKINVASIQSKNNTSLVLDKFKSSQQSIMFGFGYSYNKISGELRFNSKIDLDDYLNRESNYKKVSLIFKYSIF